MDYEDDKSRQGLSIRTGVECREPGGEIGQSRDTERKQVMTAARLPEPSRDAVAWRFIEDIGWSQVSLSRGNNKRREWTDLADGTRGYQWYL